MTTTVKNQNEFFLYYAFREIGIIGMLSIDEDGTDSSDYEDLTLNMSQENQDSLTAGDYGSALYLKVHAKPQGELPMVVVVSGTDQADATITKDITIPARTQVAQCVLVTDPGWKTITSVLAKATQPSNHAITQGVQLALVMFPQKSDFITTGKGGLINFDHGFSWKPGSTSKPIPNKFNPTDHYKRQRGENSLSISQAYTVFGQSLEFLRDRDVTILAEGHEDGSAQIFEKRYFSFVRLNVPLSAGADGADLSMEAEGHFRDMFIVE